MQNKFIEITLQHGCSPVNLLHIFRTAFSKNTSRGPPLDCISRFYFLCRNSVSGYIIRALRRIGRFVLFSRKNNQEGTME